MIPKVIHYCWFGGGPLNELSRRCVASWKKFCPDYQLVRWDESNYDIGKNEYIRRAAEAKKWAFVSDYARLDIVYRHGGIYLDTDVELVAPLDSLLKERAFLGIEYSGCVNTGVGMGGEPGVELFRTLRDAYDTETFLRPDGRLDMVPCTYYQTAILERLGYVREDRRQEVQGVAILPSEVLASRDWSGGAARTTERTVAVHHGAATWLDKDQRELLELERKLVGRFGKTLGRPLGLAVRTQRYFCRHGLRKTIQKIRGDD